MTDTQTIKDKIDIVGLIQEYLPLKKAGSNWKANCPFHHEKSPSFMVQPEKQIWHCFGCGKGGDIFSFLQEMEGLEFPEALKILADRAGIKLDNFRSEINQSVRNRILEINNKAAYFFHHFLLEIPGAKAARDYLEKRGLTKQGIINWQVGYIPDQWDLLTKYLIKKNFSIDDLVSSGLTIKREGANSSDGRGFYDRFRGRIMFPITDPHGNIVGFTGRILVEKENSGGKYVNTPQTSAYDKSRVLFGLNKAKTAIKSADLAVVVEGQMDVIACHEAGMKNVVAASGTALTPDQVRMLKRYSSNIAMAFDADSAGIKAAKRGVDIAIAEGLNVKVIQIPPGAGKDADECLKKNPAVWFQAVKDATDIMNWFFSITFSNKDASNPKDKQQIANELLPLVSLVPFAVEKDYWLRELAYRLGTDVSVLKEEIIKIKKNPINYGKIAENSNPIIKPMPIVETPLDALLERMVLLLNKFPESIKVVLGLLPDGLSAYASRPAISALYDLLEKQYNNDKQYFSSVNFSSWLSQQEFIDELNVILLKADLLFADWDSRDTSAEAKILAARIKNEWQKIRRLEIQQLLSEAEKTGDRAKIEKLLVDLQNL